jgi:glycine/D-amino acid oxidase-like deaminating enzyme
MELQRVEGEGNMARSVVVVGGGIVGAATAYFAAREGLQVTLIEQHERAHGASGRNAGYVWLHCRNPGWALEISLAGRRLYDELRSDLPVPFEFRAEGGLIYFTDERQGPVFEEFVAARTHDGLDMSLLSGAEVRDLVKPIRPDVIGGSYCAQDAQIVTSTFVHALVEGALSEGARVFEGTEVTRLIHAEDTIVGVDSTAGTFLADATVVATGAWTRQLLAGNGVEVRIGGERLQVLATQPLPLGQIRPVVYGPQSAK